jgi:ATP-dependent Clp protease ATP-binding subunit ClpX
MVSILTEPRNALVKQYQRMFEIDGVELEFDEGAVRAIAEQALSRGAGARGLRAILEEVLQDTMFEVPGREDVGQVLITRETVMDRVAPSIVSKTHRLGRDRRGSDVQGDDGPAAAPAVKSA